MATTTSTYDAPAGKITESRTETDRGTTFVTETIRDCKIGGTYRYTIDGITYEDTESALQFHPESEDFRYLLDNPDKLREKVLAYNPLEDDDELVDVRAYETEAIATYEMDWDGYEIPGTHTYEERRVWERIYV